MNVHIVFDLDGTLANTQIIHQQIESDFLKTFWIDILPEKIWQIYAWRSPQEWIPELLTKKKVNFTQKDIDKFVDYKDEKVVSLLESWKINLMKGVDELLKKLNKDWYKIWISSWACREFIDKFINYFNYWKIVEASTSANEVINKKPAPDVFLKSFEVLEEKYWKADIKWVVGDWWSDIIWGKWCNAKTIWINKNKPKDKNLLDFQIEAIDEVYDIIKDYDR